LGMLSNIGGMHMGKMEPATKPRKVTLRRLSAEVIRLRKRVEDLEDLRDLNEAIARNDGKPGMPWEQARRI
jgi:cell division protein FtsB